jgi:CDP-glucose 4,6-dehydratase
MWDPTPFYHGKSVLLTGHTGFKGGWLAHWLQLLGARVHGFALNPTNDPNLFEVSGVGRDMAGDIRASITDIAPVRGLFADCRPDIVFHLAAQALVRESYRDPLGTFATNVMGTAQVLEAARHTPSVQAIVVITTDKVYANHEGESPYREKDPLGGHDPYSASKAATEILADSYRSSFLSGAKHLATARAGNVIGGGDWAVDRLIPDCLRAFQQGTPAVLRYPDAVRPWQHVLEALTGYLKLGAALLGQEGGAFAKAWNFGPDLHGDASVLDVANLLADIWGDGATVMVDTKGTHPHEAGTLRLDSRPACRDLAWQTQWSLQNSLEQVVAWQKAWIRGEDMRVFTRSQIRGYQEGIPG